MNKSYVAVALSSVLIAACGGGGGGGSGTDSTTPGTGTPGTPTTQNVTAASCYDANLGDSPGTTYEVVSAFADSVTGMSGNATWTLSIGNLTTFQGYSAYEYDANTSTTTNEPSIKFTAVATNQVKYYQKRTGNTEVTNYGWTEVTSINSNTNGATTTTIGTSQTVFTPPWVDTSYALTPGQSLTQTYTENATITSSLNGAPATTTSSSGTFSVGTKFIGIETISVPAGTYQACRFESPDAVGTTQWFLAGTGMLIKTTTAITGSSNYTSQATSIKVNGKAI